ncbi:uncharacterized protein [Panulirus ornatus]|uniref:uncharacterized protein isoform X1 n=1 Tax=Panulirus ornatus TaxID=150431 RepID=UPI003A8350DC
MPPVRVISSLMETCSEWVWRWLHRCLNHQASPPERLRQRKYVLTTLNSNIRQKLLKRILCIHMYDVPMASKCMLLELLADRNTHWVDLTQGGYAYIDEIFHLYRTLNLGLLVGLTRLGFICNVKMKNDQKYLPDVNSTFYRLLNQMRHLQWVRLSGVADRNMLATLGVNCHSLQHVDVSGSMRVDDMALAALILKDPIVVEGQSQEQVATHQLPTNSCCATLNFVCISETQVSMMSALLLLRYVPNLTSFGGYVEAGSLSAVLQLLQPQEGVEQYKLTHLWEDRILPAQASLLKVACPHLTTLITCESSLASLPHLQPLTTLTLDLDFRGCASDIYSGLQMQGDTLKELRFLKSINCPLDLAWLMELTPNLEWIECNLYIEEGYQMPTWRLLKVASVIVSSSKVVLALLTHTPELRNLSLTFLPEPYQETFECINDDLILNTTLAGGLTRLEHLRITDCAITMWGVQCLLLHCQQLTHIAAFSSWKNISQHDIRTLQSQVQENNWQLNLVYHERPSKI